MGGARSDPRSAVARGSGGGCDHLKFSHYGTLQDTVHAAAERFQDLVEAGTDGEITIEIHPNNELGNAPTVLQGIRLGTIDIGIVGNPYFTSFEPEMNVIDLPFLFDGPTHAYEVFDGEIGRAILDKLEQHGMKGLALWEIGFRNLTNNVRPIRTPDDVQSGAHQGIRAARRERPRSTSPSYTRRSRPVRSTGRRTPRTTSTRAGCTRCRSTCR